MIWQKNTLGLDLNRLAHTKQMNDTAVDILTLTECLYWLCTCLLWKRGEGLFLMTCSSSIYHTGKYLYSGLVRTTAIATVHKGPPRGCESTRAHQSGLCTFEELERASQDRDSQQTHTSSVYKSSWLVYLQSFSTNKTESCNKVKHHNGITS